MWHCHNMRHCLGSGFSGPKTLKHPPSNAITEPPSCASQKPNFPDLLQLGQQHVFMAVTGTCKFMRMRLLP